MAGDLEEIFLLALNYFYKKYKEKGGTQKKIALKLGVTQSYVSAVLNSTKKASTELQERLADILYGGPYEEFLAVGRRLQNSLDPELTLKSEREEEVEALIKRLSHYIRDYQRIEKELVDMKNFYKVLVEKMESGVLVTDPNDNIFFVNTWLLKRIDVSKESLIGTNVLDENKKFPLSNLKEFQVYYTTAKETFEPREFTQIRLNIPSGREVYRCGWCIPILDHQKYMGMIVTIGDITEEVLLKKKLIEETWLMKLAMDSFEQTGWIILNRAKRIIKRNAEYQTIFKIPEEVLQENDYKKNIEWIRHLVRDQDNFMLLSLEFPRHGKKSIHEFDLVDGRRISRVTTPLLNDNEILGWNIMIYDITPDKEF